MTDHLTRSRLSAMMRDWFTHTALDSSSDSYVRYLTERGYTTGTINSYLRCVAHFAHWTASRHLSDDINETSVASFVTRHLPGCRCAPRCPRTITEVRAALVHLLAMLRAEQMIDAETARAPSAIAAELDAFDDYLKKVRGLQPCTRSLRANHVRAFLLACFPEGSVRLPAVMPADIAHFVTTYTARWSPASVKQVGLSLRSYLRFKATLGAETAALIAALPRVAQQRLARLPRGLSAAEIERLLGAFETTTATGRRDYAIARCYVDLGLRTAEIVRLQVDDIDGRQGTLRIRGKGGRIDVLPLPRSTGQAIVDYLRAGRRSTSSRTLFLRHRPPLDKPATTDTVRGAIRNAAQRCGLATRLTGPHILRHTLACRLVESGVPLKAIADLLRHRDLDTTTIYAKVDLKALAAVTAPWPEKQT